MESIDPRLSVGSLDEFASKLGIARRLGEPDNYLWARIEDTDEYKDLISRMSETTELSDLIESADKDRLQRVADFEAALKEL